MYVRRSNMEDIPAMMDLYAQARVFMRENGNPNQWDDSYPSRELLEKDIAFGNSYIVENDEKNLAATFAFIKGEDPTYYGIENGAWLNHEPYGTIHRLAGNTSYHGIASGCISWCKSQIGNLRADTHEDNKIMQHLLEKNGFVRCGIIHLAMVRQESPISLPETVQTTGTAVSNRSAGSSRSRIMIRRRQIRAGV